MAGKPKLKIYVGMSGGVDSSLTSALLLEQGYDVVGVYMKNWTQDVAGTACPWADDMSDAKRVAVQLGIDFKVFDFQTQYKKSVVDYMVSQYKAGRTPNPDVMCNQEVKFKLFLNAALKDGADMIATGHYARIIYGDKPSLLPRLVMAADKNKDQTYFLYRISSKALLQTKFPLGQYTKTQVRAMAKKRGLLTADKKDSVGICFVGKVGIREFLSQYVQTKPGDIIDQLSGKILGRHSGAIFFTLGQRHGLEVGGGLPYYVVGKDMAKNEVYVTTDLNDQNLWRTTLSLSDLHWINGPPPPKSNLQVRLRHRAALIGCQLDGPTLVLDAPQRAIAAGQSAVLYNSNEVLGGGIA